MSSMSSSTPPNMHGFCSMGSNMNPTPHRSSIQKFRLPIPTLGGRQFWGDLAFFQGWKIQKNIFTRHHRLLDPRKRRHASGTLKRCLKRLDEIKIEKKLEPMKGKCIVLIHGIMRDSKGFSRFQKEFQNQGYTVVPFEYPSTRIKIEKSAKFLQYMLQSLEGIDEVNFIVHSMGGLLVRAWSANHTDPRIKRMVMLGTPNTGADLANLFRRGPIFRLFLGPAGQQLVSDPESTISNLPKPPMEFAVIAGGRSDKKGYNILIPGDDDGIVSVESTRLPGAADFDIVPCIHTFLVSHPGIYERCLRFLKTGCLHEDGTPHPIC